MRELERGDGSSALLLTRCFVLRRLERFVTVQKRHGPFGIISPPPERVCVLRAALIS